MNEIISRKNLLWGMVILVLVTFLCLSGCGSWQKTSLVTFETLGIIKDNAGDLMQAKCREPETTEAECDKMRIAYNKATISYVLISKSAPKLIEANDRREYMRMRDEFIELLNIVQTMIGREVITQ
jgi:hypothetical protein